MKKLFILRHGQYRNEKDYPLSDDGKRQVRMIGQVIKGLIDAEATIRILTSTALRALQGADILADFFDVEYEQHEMLWLDNGHGMYDAPAALDLIQVKDADVIIVITHLDFANQLPQFICHQLFGDENFARRLNLKYGEGVLIDCEQESCRTILPSLAE